jgi:hypothetical protein
VNQEHDLVQHEEADSFIDWLVISFQLDLGEGHLECFSQAESLDLRGDFHWAFNDDLSCEVTFQHLLISDDQTPEIIPFPRKDKLLSTSVSLHAPLRAPPVFA